jgi:hypothetical protein
LERSGRDWCRSRANPDGSRSPLFEAWDRSTRDDPDHRDEIIICEGSLTIPNPRSWRATSTPRLRQIYGAAIRKGSPRVRRGFGRCEDLPLVNLRKSCQLCGSPRRWSWRCWSRSSPQDPGRDGMKDRSDSDGLRFFQSTPSPSRIRPRMGG